MGSGVVEDQPVGPVIDRAEAEASELLAEPEAAAFIGQARLGLLAAGDVETDADRPCRLAVASYCRLPRDAIQRTSPLGRMIR